MACYLRQPYHLLNKSFPWLERPAGRSGLPVAATKFMFRGTSVWCFGTTLLQISLIIDSSGAVANQRSRNLCSQHMESCLFFKVVEITRKFDSNFVFPGLESYPTEGVQWSTVYAKLLFSYSRILYPAFPYILFFPQDCLVDSLLLPTKWYSVSVNVSLTAICHLLLFHCACQDADGLDPG